MASVRSKRKLFLATPFTALSHAIRCLEVGRCLYARGFKIGLIGTRDSFLIKWSTNYEGVDFELHTISGTGGSPDLFRSRLDFYSNQNPLNEFDQLESLLRGTRPDAVLSDGYPLISLVCEKLRIPHMGIASAIWTKYYDGKRFPLRFDWVGNVLGEPFKWFSHRLMTVYFNKKVVTWAGPLNEIAGFMGLKKRNSVLNYLEGNQMTFITDIPEFGPLTNPPDHVRYCGPISWKPPFHSNELIRRLNDKKKTIYISFGSTGDFSLLPEMVKWLLAMDFQVMMTLNGVTSFPSELIRNQNLITADFINGFEVIPHCDAAIFHGGIGTAYQVIACGKPSLVIPDHIEQFWNGNRLQEMGLGYVLHQRLVSKKRLASMLVKAMNSSEMRERIGRISHKVANSDGANNASELISTYFD